MERSLGLICGAGVLPARMAGEARRQGWRVVAFTFGEAPGVSDQADRTVPSRVNAAGAVLAALQAEGIGSVVFSGKFWKTDLLDERRLDTKLAEMKAEAGAMTDANIVQVVVATLGRMGVELLDQRPFLGDWVGRSGCWSRRVPTDGEWEDVRRGLAVARLIADAGVGQAIVIKHGAVTAVEATEGTTETIRRGLAQAGPGAVVVKAVAREHDYRFDTPGVGPETIEVAAAGGATVLVVEAERVLVLDRDACLRIANEAGMALVGVE
ncbi:MAG: LpxI family protein [Candidatus Rokuibacteriota bacterium]